MTNFAKRIRMETTLSAKLSSLLSTAERIASQRDEALLKAEELREENLRLERELKEVRRQLEQSRLDADYLRLSHKLADTPQSLADSRALIRKLVGRVDKALRLIADDAQI